MNEKRRIRGFGIKKRRLAPEEYRDELYCKNLENIATKMLFDAFPEDNCKDSNIPIETLAQVDKTCGDKLTHGRIVTGFEKTGVNPDNHKQWQRLILRKNPWLSPGIFTR